jgi:hypothetical protein
MAGPSTVEPQSLPTFILHAVTRPEWALFDLVFYNPQGPLATLVDRIAGVNFPSLEHSLSLFVPVVAEMLSAQAAYVSTSYGSGSGSGVRCTRRSGSYVSGL